MAQSRGRLVATERNETLDLCAKVYYVHDLNEYRVELYQGGIHQVPSDYYTDDRDDANGTAFMLCNPNPLPIGANAKEDSANA